MELISFHFFTAFSIFFLLKLKMELIFISENVTYSTVSKTPSWFVL